MDSPTPLEATDKNTFAFTFRYTSTNTLFYTHTAKLEIRFFLDRLLNRSLSAEF